MERLQRVGVRTGPTFADAPASTSELPKPTFQPGSSIYEMDSSGRLHRFQCGRVLGRGGFAKCYEVSDETGTYALKAVNRASLEKPKTLQKLHSEISIHRRMKHKHVVEFLRTFRDRYYVYMLLEKCDHGTLMDLLKVRRFSVAETQYVMLQCLSALQYMHSECVIHRDLKPGNIMLDRELNVKIGDFGLAAELQYDGERKRTICGTPNYIAPEIIDHKSHGHSYEVDTWSLGVILYTLLVGQPPFQMEDVESTYKRIRQCRYDFPASELLGAPAQREVLRPINANVPPPPGAPTSPRHLANLRQQQQPTPAPTLPGTCARARSDTPRSAPATAAVPLSGRCPASSPQQLRNDDNADEDEKQQLTALHDRLHQTLTGQTGAHFNDSTKIVWEPITDRVEYYARVKIEMPARDGGTGLFAKDERHVFSMHSYPPELEKKVTLTKYFKTYLGRVQSSPDRVPVVACSPFLPAAPPRCTDPHTSSDFVYVKRWLRVDGALVFRLSNKTVQVCFEDGAEIILSSEWRVVTYTTPSGRRRTMPLNSVATEWEEAAERLRNTKSVLYQVIRDHCL
ncbi:Protein kinase domain family protein [Leishmania donovani]|uniref:Serine/threonine-protein kinase PLK n=1 Tax=Leishmania donovani TaxID=5661 RepID=A0A504XRT9_LEIDO|nr:Protein kinase domain family protein [Leishmania donovani]TPP55096.1 Protein kinase domain family protein [Leishmania donovani]